MATLSIRDLPEHVHRELRVRAARAGRSMEAEVRAILAAAVAEPATGPGDAAALQRFVDELYGESRPESAVDELLEQRRREASRE